MQSLCARAGPQDTGCCDPAHTASAYTDTPPTPRPGPELCWARPTGALLLPPTGRVPPQAGCTPHTGPRSRGLEQCFGREPPALLQQPEPGAHVPAGRRTQLPGHMGLAQPRDSWSHPSRGGCRPWDVPSSLCSCPGGSSRAVTLPLHEPPGWAAGSLGGCCRAPAGSGPALRPSSSRAAHGPPRTWTLLGQACPPARTGAYGVGRGCAAYSMGAQAGLQPPGPGATGTTERRHTQAPRSAAAPAPSKLSGHLWVRPRGQLVLGLTAA